MGTGRCVPLTHSVSQSGAGRIRKPSLVSKPETWFARLFQRARSKVPIPDGYLSAPPEVLTSKLVSVECLVSIIGTAVQFTGRTDMPITKGKSQLGAQYRNEIVQDEAVVRLVEALHCPELNAISIPFWTTWNGHRARARNEISKAITESQGLTSVFLRLLSGRGCFKRRPRPRFRGRIGVRRRKRLWGWTLIFTLRWRALLV